jgi:uncharacterized FAD-dependent dehydrogenase
MAIFLSGINVPLPGGGDMIKSAAAKRLGLGLSEISTVRVKRQSLDCRKKDIRFVYTLHVTLNSQKTQRAMEERFGRVQDYTEPEIEYGEKEAGRAVVVGTGPCGLFAALTLAKHGYRPLVLERGTELPEREKNVGDLISNGILDEESNVCFGAGGAGAFSDGKLTTRIKDMRAEYVIETLAGLSVPEEAISSKPHLGTGNIRKAVSALIGQVTSLGGELLFNCKLSKVFVSQGRLCGITYIKGGIEHRTDTRALILAIGHSARDTYEMLCSSGIALAPKAFAMGVRIEHRREFIDRAQYGEAVGSPMLGAAEYRLTAKSGGRGVYTFCMCPGGEVICSATENGALAVNGMSFYERNAENSNSAVVVGVRAGDLGAGSLSGVDFQRTFERAAFVQGFIAPAQTLGDFMKGSVSQKFGDVKPSYKPGIYFKDLSECLPSFVTNALKEGIKNFGKQLRGFDMPDAVLTGVETRTSSPVRILRNDDFQALGAEGLFPAGEGAGYAGGIVSAAADGMKCAESLMKIYKRQ